MSLDISHWPEEQREALKRWKTKDPDERTPDDLLPRDENEGGSRVSRSECSDMRIQYKDDVSTSSIASHFGYDSETIRMHVFGRCSHDIDESPVESPVTKTPDEYVKGDDCRNIRKWIHERDNRSILDAKDEFDTFTYYQIYFHSTGRCNCSVDVPSFQPNGQKN